MDDTITASQLIIFLRETNTMLSKLLVLFSATLLFILASIFMLFRSNGNKQQASPKIPPGYLGLPFIGEAFAFAKPHPSTSLGPFMQTRIARFGKIFTTKLLRAQTVVSADAELNRFVLRNENRLFVPGWPRAINTILGEASTAMGVGDEHRYMRSTVLEFLSSVRVRTVFLQDANRAASEIMSSWKDHTVISAKDEATKFSFYVMAKKMLSMTPMDPEIKRLQIEYESIIKGFKSLPLNLPGTTYWKALLARKQILGIFKKEMENRKGNSVMEKDDFLNWLTKNTHYSEEYIGDLLFGVLFGGHDTTSRAITGMIYFLQGCKPAVEKLREEHLEVARKQQGGEISLTWDDYNAMEFTKCVINETLRLGIASMVQRKATEDVEFNGHLIPKDYKVLLHFKAMHLDPSIFEDPECFNPWRWLSSSSEKLSNNFMPFGSGARFCPGAELARLEMAIFLHHLILKHDWELAEPDCPLDIPYVEYPKGLPIRVRAI